MRAPLSKFCLMTAVLSAPSAHAAQFNPSKPFFGFACHPKNSAVTAPTFQYLVFLSIPSTEIPPIATGRVEISKLQGLPNGPDQLTLSDSRLLRMQAMPSPDGKSEFTLFKIEATSSNAGTPGSYSLSMFFGIEHDLLPDGRKQFVGIRPSNGTFKADGQTFELTCPDLSGRAAPERG